MVTITEKMKMVNPNDSSDFWTQALSFGKVFAPWASIGWIMHQGINKIFKYFSDSRDAELREIVKTEMKPRLDEVNNKIDHMDEKMDTIQRTIGELNTRLK